MPNDHGLGAALCEARDALEEVQSRIPLGTLAYNATGEAVFKIEDLIRQNDALDAVSQAGKLAHPGSGAGVSDCYPDLMTIAGSEASLDRTIALRVSVLEAMRHCGESEYGYLRQMLGLLDGVVFRLKLWLKGWEPTGRPPVPPQG